MGFGLVARGDVRFLRLRALLVREVLQDAGVDKAGGTPVLPQLDEELGLDVQRPRLLEPGQAAVDEPQELDVDEARAQLPGDAAGEWLQEADLAGGQVGPVFDVLAAYQHVFHVALLPRQQAQHLELLHAYEDPIGSNPAVEPLGAQEEQPADLGVHSTGTVRRAPSQLCGCGFTPAVRLYVVGTKFLKDVDQSLAH